MARLHTNQPYSDTRGELSQFKDYRRGALEDAFWDEDEPVDYRPSSRRRKPKKKKGCPGNDYKAHVYVWVETLHYRSRLTAYGFVEDKSRPPYKVREKTCCGCSKVTRRKYDWSNYYG